MLKSSVATPIAAAVRRVLRDGAAPGGRVARRTASGQTERATKLSVTTQASGISIDRYRAGASDAIFVTGQPVSARIMYINELGAMTSVDGGAAHGLLDLREIAMFQSVYGKKLRTGDTVPAYVARRLPSTSPVSVNAPYVALLLRPAVRDRIQGTAEIVQQALQESATGTLSIGDKSTPEEVSAVLAGVSKTDFKRALGQLFKAGVAFPDAKATYLSSRHPDLVRQKLSAKVTNGNVGPSKPLFRSGEDRTLFVGPIPKSFSTEEVTALVNAAALEECVEAARLAMGPDGRPRGFAFVLLSPSVDVDRIVRACRGAAQVAGRSVRINRHEDSGLRRLRTATGSAGSSGGSTTGRADDTTAAEVPPHTNSNIAMNIDN